MQQQARLFAPTLAPSATGRPWLASRLLRRQVVNVATLDQIGRVADVAFDWRNGQLTGLRIQRDAAPRGLAAAFGRVFGRNPAIELARLDQIVALNGDVVMVDTQSSGSVAPKAAKPPKDARVAPAPAVSSVLDDTAYLNEVCELAILTTYGVCLGTLADLLLDERGDTILGYVIEPTAQAEDIAPLLEVMMASATPAQGEADAPIRSRLRVIPASANIRFGDALILLVAQVEPMQRGEVFIAPATGATIGATPATTPPEAMEVVEANAPEEATDATPPLDASTATLRAAG